MKHYKTIISSNIKEFESRCKYIKTKGYEPLNKILTHKNSNKSGEIIVTYTQQYVKNGTHID